MRLEARLGRGRRLGLEGLCAWLALATATAAPGPGTTVHSRSGQFVIHSPYLTAPSMGVAPAARDARLVSLAPDPLAVGCERIKQGVLRELGLPDRWHGKVHVWLHPEARGAEIPRVISTRFADGWQYTLHVPEKTEAVSLVRAVVHATLLDVANRSPGPHPPEIPIWLVEGMAGALLSRAGPDLVPQPNALVGKLGDSWGQLEPGTRDLAAAESIRGLRLRLRARAAWSFDEIGIPPPALLEGENLEAYRAAAHVFLAQLQRLPNGPAMLAAFLARLTQHLNWQTAFLSAFRRVFPDLLAVEKWWAVTLVQFQGGDEAHALSRAASLQKLDDVLRIGVEVRNTPRDPPQRGSVTLQQVVKEWDFPQQDQVLRPKVRQLQFLLPVLALEVVPLAAGYQSALNGFLVQRVRFLYPEQLAGAAAADYRLLVRDTLRHLDELDHQRASRSGD